MPELAGNPLEHALRQAQNLIGSLPRPGLPFGQDRRAQAVERDPLQHSGSGQTAAAASRPPVGARAQPLEALDGLPVSKEELGRATWTFLHTLAAQFPDRPTRGQQKDARALVRGPCAQPTSGCMQAVQVQVLTQPAASPAHHRCAAAQVDIMTRMYPCQECADHFREIVRCTSASGLLLACFRCA